MINIRAHKPENECPECDDAREVIFTFSGDYVSCKDVSYHHERRDLLEFATRLRELDRAREGSASLVSKNENSVLKLKFLRAGGELGYSAEHEMDFAKDRDMFDTTLSYFGEIPSEDVGRFLTKLIDTMESV